MAARYQAGDYVWVPSAQLHDDRFALVRRPIVRLLDRSVVVDGPDGEEVKIATRRVHRHLSFLVLKIGDYHTEPTLLDPLAKSALQYLRLLMPDDQARVVQVRTEDEIAFVMEQDGAQYSHVVVIGHGAKDRIIALGNGIPGARFGELLAHGDPKVVISLACSTGQKPFAEPLSKSASCREFVAPFREAHGAAASLFLQTLLHLHLLRGKEFPAAFRIANAVLDGTNFQHWRNGTRRVPSNPSSTDPVPLREETFAEQSL